MVEPVIEAELVEERIVACPQCRRSNRLHKRSATGVYRCGACRAVLPNPFRRRRGRPAFRRQTVGYVIASVAALALLIALFAAVFENRSPIAAVSAPTAEIANTIIPVNNQILFNAFYGSMSKGELTVDNGTSRHAVAKLINLQVDRKVLSFVVSAHQKSTIRAIPDGTYRLLFAFGDRLYTGTDRFFSPHGFSKFDSPLLFTTSSTDEAMYWDQLSVTLHPVFTGNAKTSSISQKEFERY